MGVDLAQITFLGLTVQTWITVVIAAFGLMVSLLTFAIPDLGHRTNEVRTL